MKHVTISLDRRRPLKDGTYPIVLVIRNVKSFRFPTGYHVKEEQYSSGSVVKRPDRNRINRALFGLTANAEELLSRGLTDRQFKTALSGGELRGSFAEHYRKYLGRTLTDKTRESYEYTLATLERHCDFDRLSFEDVNYAFLCDLEAALRKEGLSVNTVKIHFGNIRAVMNDAINAELTSCYPFRRFRIKREKTIKRSLSVDELARLHEAEREPYQDKYIDWFFLMFHLIGINAKDMFALTDDNVRHGRVEYRRSKTHGVFSVRLLPEAEELIARLKEGGRLCGFDGYADSVDLRHRVNVNLKAVCARNGLPPCTTYWARHTWATVAAGLDVPDDTIAVALGHQGVSPVTDRYIRRDMGKVDDANARVAEALRKAVETLRRSSR